MSRASVMKPQDSLPHRLFLSTHPFPRLGGPSAKEKLIDKARLSSLPSSALRLLRDFPRIPLGKGTILINVQWLFPFVN